MKIKNTYSLKKIILSVVVLELFLWAALCAFYFWIQPSIKGLVIQRPVFIWVNVGLTFFSIIFILIYYWKNRSLLAFSSANLMDKISPKISSVLAIVKYIILRLALLSALIAIINPRYGSKEIEAKTEGIDIMIALDVSNSMLAEDIKPNRLTRAKMALEQLINNLHGDRLGLVIFAGDAYLQLPITSDYSAAKIFLEDVDTEILPVQGTAIGSSIDLCIESFDENNTSARAIIVITDGENHEDDALESAKKAAKEGIKVYTIGMGSQSGSPIPIVKRGRKAGFKKDKEGNTVVSKLNEIALREIAKAGNGEFSRATVNQVGLKGIFEGLDKMDKNEISVRQYADYEDRFQLFLLIAIVLLIVESILPDRKTRWSGKVNLFE